MTQTGIVNDADRHRKQHRYQSPTVTGASRSSVQRPRCTASQNRRGDASRYYNSHPCSKKEKIRSIRQIRVQTKRSIRVIRVIRVRKKKRFVRLVVHKTAVRSSVQRPRCTASKNRREDASRYYNSHPCSKKKRFVRFERFVFKQKEASVLSVLSVFEKREDSFDSWFTKQPSVVVCSVLAAPQVRTDARTRLATTTAIRARKRKDSFDSRDSCSNKKKHPSIPCSKKEKIRSIRGIRVQTKRKVSVFQKRKSL